MWRFFAKECDSDAKLNGKTVICTGGSSGIGKETAKDLYKRGARVIILSRNEEKTKQVINDIKSEAKQISKHHDVIFKKIDLEDFNSIESCAKEILAEEEYIHILINGAGILCAPDHNKDFDIPLRVNYLGHVLLTLLLLPKLIKSGDTRIINVSSFSHKCPLYGGTINLDNFKNNHKTFIKAIQTYCESKTALIMFSKELARRLKDADVTNVTVVSCHPGYTNSDLWKQLDVIFWGVHFMYSLLVGWQMLSARQAAQTVIYCAVEDKVKQHSGAYISYCDITQPHKVTDDEQMVKELWEGSLKMLNMEHFKLSDSVY